VLIILQSALGMPEKKVVPANEVETKIRADEQLDNCIVVGDPNLNGLRIEGYVHSNFGSLTILALMDYASSGYAMLRS